MGVFHFLHHEHAVKITHTVDITQFGTHKLLIRLHIAGLYLQREIVLATGVVTFRYLIDALILLPARGGSICYLTILAFCRLSKSSQKADSSESLNPSEDESTELISSRSVIISQFDNQ